jgi:hypothetical protein
MSPLPDIEQEEETIEVEDEWLLPHKKSWREKSAIVVACLIAFYGELYPLSVGRVCDKMVLAQNFPFPGYVTVCQSITSITSCQIIKQ